MKNPYNIYDDIEEFENTEFAIESVFFDIALEEDMSNDTTIDDDTNKESFGKKLQDKIKHLIDELFAIVDRFISKISNIFKRIIATDKGFQTECRKAIRDNKPLEAIKLVAYKYNDSSIDQQLAKVTNVIQECFHDLDTSYKSEKDDTNQSILDMKQKDMYAEILKKIGCPSNVTDINLYYEYLKKQFRGDKQEILFTATKAKVYYNFTNNYKNIEKRVNGDKAFLQNQANKVKINLSSIIKNHMTQDTIKKRAMKQSANATHLFNFYSSFISIYIELKIEELMMYRIVLKKLYHF